MTTPATHTLAPSDFVVSGNMHGQIERISEDGQALITHYTPVRNGWEPSLKRANYKLNALTKIDELKAPEGASTRMRVVNRGESTAELIIYADIGEGWFGGISSKEFSDQLSAIGDVKNLDVRMNSAGGDVFEGITMYNRLKQHTANVRVIVDGLAASIASVIAMAADEVVVYDASTVMIHKPWTFAGGDADDMRDKAAQLDLVEKQMINIYTQKTGLDETHIKRLLKAETWMSGEEAVNLGFADNLDSDMPQAMAAAIKPNMNAKWFAHAPTQPISNPELQETIRRARGQSLSLLSRSRAAV